MRFLQAVLLILFVLTVHAQDAQVEKLLGKYNGIKSFSSDYQRSFTQNSTGKKSSDNGTILFIAPSEIRMDTFFEGKLTEQTFLNSEKTVFIYHSKKNILVKKSAGDEGEYLAFLQGLDEVRKKFTISDSTDSVEKARKTGIEIKDGARLYKLTPKKEMGNVKYIFITSVKDEIESVVIIDQLKNINQFKFSNIKYNPKLEKKQFAPVYPQGYEVSNF
ncbi:MAG TPA: outer-membrane lipoprotein carrier protein LolA [bacterium]|nr:outer-membrane lipoprotein carrier protein LolA [bacterium]